MPGIRPQQADEGLHDGALAGAVRADEAVDAAFRYGEADALDGIHASPAPVAGEALVNVFNLDGVHVASALSMTSVGCRVPG